MDMICAVLSQNKESRSKSSENPGYAYMITNSPMANPSDALHQSALLIVVIGCPHSDQIGALQWPLRISAHLGLLNGVAPSACFRQYRNWRLWQFLIRRRIGGQDGRTVLGSLLLETFSQKAPASAHSINGFLCFPTIVTPRQCKAFASPARMIVASGSIGFSALTCAASLAACSIASISALQLA